MLSAKPCMSRWRVPHHLRGGCAQEGDEGESESESESESEEEDNEEIVREGEEAGDAQTAWSLMTRARAFVDDIVCVSIKEENGISTT